MRVFVLMMQNYALLQQRGIGSRHLSLTRTKTTILQTLQPMKFIGFLLFIIILLTGFSMLIFLALFVGYWLTLLGLERVMPDRIYKWLEGAKR
jgi:F0F1-type ATP synthase assembly protein I